MCIMCIMNTHTHTQVAYEFNLYLVYSRVRLRRTIIGIILRLPKKNEPFSLQAFKSKKNLGLLKSGCIFFANDSGQKIIYE